jgi:lipopolysaccharide transport system permease protein
MIETMEAFPFYRPFLIRTRALWRYKGFVSGMVWREFRSRYLNSLFGSIWSILNPVAMIFVYTVIFSKIMQARLAGSNDTMAYGIFLCAGLLPWGFFSELLARCPNIFIEQANLLKKISFPRVTLPLILFLSTAVNFAIIFIIFLLFLLITGRFPGLNIVAFVPLLILQQVFALGLGMVLGSINVFFRDVGQFIGIVLQFWFWLTPIVYPVTILPERIHRIIDLNPMTRLVAAYQEIVLHGHWPQWSLFRFHLIGALTALIIGFVVFRRLSVDIVDEL